MTDYAQETIRQGVVPEPFTISCPALRRLYCLKTSQLTLTGKQNTSSHSDQSGGKHTTHNTYICHSEYTLCRGMVESKVVPQL